MASQGCPSGLRTSDVAVREEVALEGCGLLHSTRVAALRTMTLRVSCSSRGCMTTGSPSPSRRSPRPARHKCLLILLSTAAVACTSSKPVMSGDASPDKPVAANEDGASSQDSSNDRGCVPTGNPGICSPIVHCAPCDGGLCGAVSNLDGCDQEGATCIAQGQQLCTGTLCTCSGGFWKCAPLGQSCARIGDSCTYLVNFGGGGASIFYCRACAGDGGGPKWIGAAVVCNASPLPVQTGRGHTPRSSRIP
jgi:hypothetical protein